MEGGAEYNEQISLGEIGEPREEELRKPFAEEAAQQGSATGFADKSCAANTMSGLMTAQRGASASPEVGSIGEALTAVPFLFTGRSVATDDLAFVYQRAQVVGRHRALASQAMRVGERAVSLDKLLARQSGDAFESVDVLAETTAEQGRWLDT